MAQESINANSVFVGIAILGILVIAIGAFTFLEVNSLKQAVSNSDNAALLAKISQMEQRITSLEKGGTSSTASNVTMQMSYSSEDPFSTFAQSTFATLQSSLATQGITLRLQDVAGEEATLALQGVRSLPGLFIASSEASKNPALEQQLVNNGFLKLGNGYFADAYAGGIVGFRTILANQTCNADGKPLLMEFSDFECPYCKQVFPDLKQFLTGLNGSLAFQYKNFPLDAACNSQMSQTLHPNACSAAVAAQCAREQGKFDRFHDLLYSATSLSNSTYFGLAEIGNLDMAKFSKCMANTTSAIAKIKSDIKEGAEYEIPGTPTFVLNCKYQFGATTLADLKKYVCTAEGSLCSA